MAKAPAAPKAPKVTKPAGAQTAAASVADPAAEAAAEQSAPTPEPAPAPIVEPAAPAPAEKPAPASEPAPAPIVEPSLADSTVAVPAAEGFVSAAPDGIDAEKLRELVEDSVGADYFAGKVLLVRSVAPTGRRRAGRAFTQATEPVPCDELTFDQICALITDPQLAVGIQTA